MRIHMTNVLLQSNRLPPFDALTAADVVPAIKQLTQETLAAIDALAADPQSPTAANFLQPLEAIHDRLSQAWSPIGHLAHVMDTPALREAYKEALAMISEFHTTVGQHQALFTRYTALDVAALDGPQAKAVKNALLSFRLSGIDLPQKARERFAEIALALSELGNQFQDNVLDATQGWTINITDEAALDGLPESAMTQLANAAKARDLKGWLVTLDAPAYIAIMTYANDRALRQQVATAFVTRASDQGPQAGQWDNGPLIERILALKAEQAALLGYQNYAEVSLAEKMAHSTDQVLGFLHELADRSVPQAKQEVAELIAFAQDELGLAELAAWDLAWVGEQLRERRYAVSQEMIRPYFPAPQALKGLFEVCHRLFGIHFEANHSVATYHADAQYFDVIRDGQTIAGCYVDLYARIGKRGGAWMDVCRTKRDTATGPQLPVAYLNCNFSAPDGDKPALLTHDDLTTLFHEFGHGLHHMLTQISVADVSGISGVAWDAVELPSQFMENYCWQPESLAFISGHVDTGAPLPKALLDKMLAAKNFQSAMHSVRQLEFGLFDFELHSLTAAPTIAEVRATLAAVRKRVCVVPVIAENRFENGFSHIFAGGYAAGYYSYKWAEVLSADAFSLFEEQGIFDPATGKAFYDEILSQGGSKDAMELFVAFRGREPKVDALLRHTDIGG